MLFKHQSNVEGKPSIGQENILFLTKIERKINIKHQLGTSSCFCLPYEEGHKR